MSTWMLDSGPETCEFCWRGFYIEMGYHCFDCDQPICPVCVVTLTSRRAVICPRCHEESD